MPISTFHQALTQLDQVKKYNLNISGIAGFFGGQVAVVAMGTVHMYSGRKYLGWYNSPGSYEIAKSYGVLGASKLWDALYPGANVEPAVLFGLEGKIGPTFRGAQSGTFLSRTGHLGYLFMEECRRIPIPKDNVVHGRVTKEATLTVVDLNHVPQTILPYPTFSGDLSTFLAFVPITVTLVAAIMCPLVADDWFCFGLILYGAFASGLSCLVIGSGELYMKHHEPSRGVPFGDGILGADQANPVLLLGEEGAVNTVTQGAFVLKLPGGPQYNQIGFCALLLTIQFIAQLLIIPLGTLFGQLMFLTSVGVSWLYTTYLASLDRESLQRQIVDTKLLQLQSPQKTKYQFGTRTAMTVYILQTLRSRFPPNMPDNEVAAALRKVLHDLLPNETSVWRRWKQTTLDRIVKSREPGVQTGVQISHPTGDDLRNNLLADADVALDFYRSRLEERSQQVLVSRRSSSTSTTV